jgi:hypothetical protein
MAGVVVALARWPARWNSSETGSAHTAKGAARALNAASSEPRSMPSSAREKPRGERQNSGRSGTGRGSTTLPDLEGRGRGDAERRLERRLCDGGADPQREKRSMLLTFQGLLWLVGEVSRQGAGREKGVPSFPFALASASSTLLMVFKGR